MSQPLLLDRRAVLAGLSSIVPLASAAAVTSPSSPTESWPSGWDDPRFARNAVSPGRIYNTGSTLLTWQNLTVEDESGDALCGSANYELLNTRYRGREGPRVSGSNVLIDGCYIEVHGTGDDHADGIQGYKGGSQGNAKNIVIRNTKVVMTTGALNCGIFFADMLGADLTLENVYVDGANAPNGAIWLPCAPTDKGVLSLIARNVMVKNSNGRQGLSLAPNPRLCNIIEWTGVRWGDGTPIRRPTQ